MIPSDLQRFALVWATAYKLAGKDTPDKFVIEVAFQVLKDFSLEQVEEAVARHLRDPDRGMFVPKPADVVRQIEGGAGAKESQAIVAWRKLVDNYAYYDSVVFDDAHIHRVVQAMGGWKGLNEKLIESEMKWMQREFEKLYLGLPKSGEYPRKLTGHMESHNSQIPGARILPPRLIGNEAAARLVLEGGGDEKLTNDNRAGLRPIAAYLGMDEA